MSKPQRVIRTSYFKTLNKLSKNNSKLLQNYYSSILLLVFRIYQVHKKRESLTGSGLYAIYLPNTGIDLHHKDLALSV